MFGGRATIFLASLWGGPFYDFYKNAFEGRATIFVAQVFTSSLQTQNSLYLSPLYLF